MNSRLNIEPTALAADNQNKAVQDNVGDLERELIWLAGLLDSRFKLYFKPEGVAPLPEGASVFDLDAPDLSESSSLYAGVITQNLLNYEERAALILALTPLLRPQMLDIFFTKNSTFDRRFTEFGGVIQGGDFIPTVETLVFILAEGDLALRLRVMQLFDSAHTLVRENICNISPVNSTDNILKAPLRLADDYISLFLQASKGEPQFSQHFPAKKIKTDLSWDDLVLHPNTARQIQEINTWVEYGKTLTDDWAMGSKIRPGYRALFYGPPGTGKTMTACLLGKTTGHEVYKIDLSMVVSKYIGETEKNLSKVFDMAESKGWILFFDEADALFGKRTETQNSHDRYANQEVAFLLQRIESFDGVVILSSNLKDNIDDAFARRFESMIFFPIPKKEERLKIWQKSFSAKAELDESINLVNVAKDFDLAGGAIINVVRYASMLAISRGQTRILMDDIQQGISREYRKEGKR
ncbi:MAG: AAA family ATPase [Alteromonadaceae bacterium]|nr:MAG: AAA family ATPase [Alteromonadaceae bacterium]